MQTLLEDLEEAIDIVDTQRWNEHEADKGSLNAARACCPEQYESNQKKLDQIRARFKAADDMEKDYKEIIRVMTEDRAHHENLFLEGINQLKAENAKLKEEIEYLTSENAQMKNHLDDNMLG